VYYTLNEVQNTSGHMEVLTVEQLGELIHKSPASIRSDASRNPSALPPICRLPGTKRLLWRLADVQSWLASHVEKQAGYGSIIPVMQDVPRKRGRPRKTAIAVGAI
jgi:hypothetical protein